MKIEIQKREVLRMDKCPNLACGFMYYCLKRENKPNFVPPCKRKLEKRGNENADII